MKNPTMKTLRALLFGALALFLFSTTSCKEDDDDDDMMGRTLNVYTSSNTSGMVTVMSFEDNQMSDNIMINVNADDADGIWYDGNTDKLYQVNRSDNEVNVYTGFSGVGDGSTATPAITSSSDFFNGRGIAASSDKVVVAQDADLLIDNELYVYLINGSSLTLINNYEVDINLWGIQAVGNDLWAIQDNSDTLVYYQNFFDNPDGMIMPTKKVQIQGIIRTHGIWYDADNDVMLLTDVGDAASDSDGAYHMIDGFMAKFNAGSSIAVSAQTRVAGSNTNLGNPVDIKYDAIGGMVYVAERANGGGRLLQFDASASGNTAPAHNMSVSGISSISIDEE